MSDIEDYDDDLDFAFLDWFYIEDPDDEAGDLAEHAVASPPPIEYTEQEEEWDRFAYWNDIEYDSDGYNDVDTERRGAKRRTAKQDSKKRKTEASPMPQSPRKRRKGQPTPPAIQELSPVVWRSTLKGNTAAPTVKGGVDSFALLKDWRARFPDRHAPAASDLEAPSKTQSKGSSAENVELDIDPDILRAALQANMSNLTGSSASNDPKEAMLLNFVTKMLSGGGSADDVAGELADALFAKEGESADGDSDGGGGGAFGQWVLGRAEEQAKGGAQGSVGVDDEPSPAKSHEDGEENAMDVDVDVRQDQSLPESPVRAVPADRRPPTPSSAQAGIGNDRPQRANGHEGEVPSERFAQPAVAAPKEDVSLKGRKRKAEGDHDADVAATGRPKRAATHSFNAPTASSRAKSVSGLEQGGKGKGKKPVRPPAKK